MNDFEQKIDIPKVAEFIFIGFKWLSMAGLLISFSGLALSITSNYSLWFNSTKSTGIITEYKTVYLSERSRSNSSVSSFGIQLPVIMFTDLNGKKIQFDGKFGHSNDQKGEIVSIIFSNRNPENAIIDLGNFHNWLSTYIWLFCLMCSSLGVKHFSKKPNFGYLNEA